MVFVVSRYKCTHTHEVSEEHTQGVTQGECTYNVSTLTNSASILRQGSGSFSKISRSDYSELSVDIHVHRHHKCLEMHVHEVRQGDCADEKAHSKLCLSFETRVRVFFKDEHVKWCLSSPDHSSSPTQKVTEVQMEDVRQGDWANIRPCPSACFFCGFQTMVSFISLISMSD